MGVEDDLSQWIVGSDPVVHIHRVVSQQLCQIRHPGWVNAVLRFLDAQNGAILHVGQHQDQGDVTQRAIRE